MSLLREATDDERYGAGNTRFGGGTLMLQPLPSGHWALMDSGWELLGIFDPSEVSMADFAEVVVEFAERGRRGYAKQAAVEEYRFRDDGASWVTDKAEDLGL